MKNNTDLALESLELHDSACIDGVSIEESDNLTIVEVLNDNGSSFIGKPIGKYLTLHIKSFENDTDIFDGRLDDFSLALSKLLPDDLSSVLVVGLGNERMTADSLGPCASSFVLATRHIIDDLQTCSSLDDLFPVASVSTGVLGATGIESAEIVKGISSQIHPSCIIAIDALAATSADRLGNTVQLSDTGISPGSGVGNHRHEISLSTIGVPVISVGIPTVVRTSIISGNPRDTSFVTPRDIDRIIQQGAKLIGMGINVCFQSSMDARDMFTLVG